MAEIDLITLAALVAVAFAAGFVDSIAGGGGLLTLPALLIAGLTPAAAVATNKVQSVFGTASATWTMWRAGYVDLRRFWPAVVMAAIGSAAGALVVQAIDPAALAAVMPAVLVVVALYFLLTRRLADHESPPTLGDRGFALGPTPAIGFYDGVFGPGTGSFFMLACVSLLGLDARRATGTTKLLNFTTNAAAFVAFLVGGAMIWAVGLAMATGQVVGARLGAKAAIGHGARLVRPLIVVMCVGMAIRLCWPASHPIGGAVRALLGIG